MLFSELAFLFGFLPLFFLCTFAAKKNLTAQNIILLIFSMVFYAWGEPVYIFLLLISIGGNFVAGIAIDKFKDKITAKKISLALGTIFNLGLICVFKYSGFFCQSINDIFGSNIPVPEISLPIGISFYTFQILSYIIDVYRGEVPVQKNILFLGAYLVAFPQLIAGPIARYQTIAEELTDRTVTIEDLGYGFRRFIIGLGKKVLIANNAAVIADSLLAGDMKSFGALGAWLAMIAYTLQIYYDFSGYSDMAIGLGRTMGFHYLENFNYPYMANSATDFWRRWHISLSTFFRDYVYIPMGGNRVSKPRWILNMFTVWFLTGLWHGAGANFILWGLYFFVILIAEKTFLSGLQKIKVLNHITALLIIVVGWCIFRCESLSQIGTVLGGMFGVYGGGDLEAIYASGVLKIPYFIALIAGIIGSVPMPLAKLKSLVCTTNTGKVVADVAVMVVLFVSVAMLARGSYNPFIYFRF